MCETKQNKAKQNKPTNKRQKTEKTLERQRKADERQTVFKET